MAGSTKTWIELWVMRWRDGLQVAIQAATFIVGLFFMNQVVTYHASLPAWAQLVVAWMVGFPIASLIDFGRARAKKEDDD